MKKVKDCIAVQYFAKMYMTRAATRVEDLVLRTH